jgi:hypothetical protein
MKQENSADICTILNEMTASNQTLAGIVESEVEDQPEIGMKRSASVDLDSDDQDRKIGRRKIKIEYIQERNRRHITFSKRKAGIMKKAYELSTLTGTQVLLLVASETGHVYTFATPKLQPMISKAEGKTMIQNCLNSPDASTSSSPEHLPPHQSSALHIHPSSAHHLQPTSHYYGRGGGDVPDTPSSINANTYISSSSTGGADVHSLESGGGQSGSAYNMGRRHSSHEVVSHRTQQHLIPSDEIHHFNYPHVYSVYQQPSTSFPNGDYL